MSKHSIKVLVAQYMFIIQLLVVPRDAEKEVAPVLAPTVSAIVNVTARHHAGKVRVAYTPIKYIDARHET